MEPQCVRVFKCVVFTRLNNPGQVRRGDQQVEKKQLLGFQIIFNEKSKILFENGIIVNKVMGPDDIDI